MLKELPEIETIEEYTITSVQKDSNTTSICHLNSDCCTSRACCTQ